MIRDLLMAQVNQWLATLPDVELMRMVEDGVLSRLSLEQVLKLQLLVNNYVDRVRDRHNKLADALVALKARP